MNWQPISTAPQDGTEFVVCNTKQGGVKTLVSWNTIHGFWQSKGNYHYLQETLWFPLPEVPNAELRGRAL